MITLLVDYGDCKQYCRPVTNYEYEEKLENKKREIFILKQEYLSVVIDDIDDICNI